MRDSILKLPFLLAVALWSSLTLAQVPVESVSLPNYHRVPGNLLQNGSFENNWFNHHFADRRRFLLLQASDMGMGEGDGKIDHWTALGTAAVWDTTVARVGSRSLRFDGAGRVSQLIRFAGENSPRAGGAFYAYFMPMEKRLAWEVLRRPIVVGAWCRTLNVPAGAEPKLSVKIDCGARQRFEENTSQITFGKKVLERSAIAAGKTHDWQYLEVRVEAAELESAPWLVMVTVASAGKGTVWFDDVSCVETATSGLPKVAPRLDAPVGAETVTAAAAVELVNRLSDGGFEATDASGWAVGWQRPVLWTWFRNEYYAFTGWSHFKSRSFRGTAVIDRLLSWSGNASLRMNVLPGDNFAVESAVIALNQKTAQPIEVRAMVKSDNLRTLEIMGRDERGAWLRQGDFLGDAMQEPGAYNMASTGAGTSDWVCVRKFFSPERPVQSLTLALGVRGFDGQLVADKNIVGTVWIDDVQVFEHGGEQAKTTLAKLPEVPANKFGLLPFKVLDLDLGERLWGRNAVGLTVEFHGRDLARVKATSLRLAVSDPQGRVTSSQAMAEIVKSPAGPDAAGLAVLRAEYSVKTLCETAKEQYRLTLQLFIGDEPLGPASEFAFGTPAKVISSGVSGYYFYRDEKPLAFANVNVARASLKDLACQFVVRTGAREKVVLEQTDLSAIGLPQTASDYINTRNLVQAALGSDGFTVRPWTDPQRDNSFQARLLTKVAGKLELVAETVPVEFGFMEMVPPPKLEKIERTAVNDKGFITINGRPYFPVYWRPHGSSKSPESDYPVQALGYKALNLTSLVLSKPEASDAEVKAAVLARVEAVKNSPDFFQYEIGEGEMQLQGKEWVDRKKRCETAIGWIREADPNHLINGPLSWLVGHPGHDEAMKAFVGSWDVIGVESSFESRVLINQLAKPLMTRRQTAVLVGLETYFYQPLEVLRWRGYRAVLDGAHGIGLCPSGMLESRPDKVNALRGLNAEFRSLAPAIVGDEPAARCTSDSEQVDLMERVVAGKRYLIAVRSKSVAGAVIARFSFPPGFSAAGVRVCFEGRSIQAGGGGFADEFASAYSVHVYQLE